MGIGLVLDFIIVAIILLNIIIGYKNGLIKVIFNIVGFVAAIIITLFLFKPIAKLVIENTTIDEKIKETIVANMSKESETENKTEETTAIQNFIENKIKDKVNETRNDAVNMAASEISVRATEILTAILLFIILRVILMILKLFTSSIEDLPVIKQFNEVGGAIYGFLKAVIIILLLITILYFVVSIKPDGILAESIENSYITKVLYENNIIIKYCLLDKNLL